MSGQRSGDIVGAVLLAACAAVVAAALPVIASNSSGAASPTIVTSPPAASPMAVASAPAGASPTAVASPPVAASPGIAALDEPFDLAVGESAVVDGALHVTFGSVIEDSRCPSDVECVWEGNAEVAVEVSVDGQEPAELRLNTNPRFSTRASYLEYAVTLVEVSPYPRQEPPPEGAYVATLVVDGGRVTAAAE